MTGWQIWALKEPLDGTPKHVQYSTKLSEFLATPERTFFLLIVLTSTTFLSYLTVYDFPLFYACRASAFHVRWRPHGCSFEVCHPRSQKLTFGDTSLSRGM